MYWAFLYVCLFLYIFIFLFFCNQSVFIVCYIAAYLSVFDARPLHFFSYTFWSVHYARQQNASRILAIVEASVRPSVILRYCVKTTQARITRSSTWAAIRTLVFRDKMSCPWVKWFPWTRATKRGTFPLKRRYFRYCLVWCENGCR